MKNELKIDLERLLNYFKINKLRKNMLYQFKNTNILFKIVSFDDIYARFARKKDRAERRNEWSRLNAPLSGAFNSLKWKFSVDIVSTGQQCLVETKRRTARIYNEEEQSLTGILQLSKWCYRLRGIKDNSLLSRIAAKA